MACFKNSLPEMLLMLILFVPILIADQGLSTSGSSNDNIQSSGYHRSIKRGPILSQPPYSIDLQRRPSEIVARSNDKLTWPNAQETTFDTKDQENQNRLLRQFSSIMLLESLLKNPNKTNKSQFPLISLATPKLIKNRQDIEDSKNLDVSTTNVTTVTDSGFTPTSNINQSDHSVNTNQVFDAKSLKYLVDKLLTLSPPSDRYDYYKNHINIIPNLERLNNETSSQNAKRNSEKTLDLLIKEEHDSRVASVKSSSDRKKVSSMRNDSNQNNSNLNHRDSSRSSLQKSVSTLRPLLTENGRLKTTSNPIRGTIRSTSHTKSIDRSDDESESGQSNNEDSIDDNDEEVDDSTQSPEKQAKSENEISRAHPSPKLQVPPYQLGDRIESLVRGDSNSVGLDIQPTRASIDHSGAEQTQDQPEEIDQKLDRSSSLAPKNPLVFSDGVDEVDRANRRREQYLNDISFSDGYGSRNPVTPDDKRNNTSSQQVEDVRKSNKDRASENHLLDHLLSTVQPLSSLDKRLRDHEISLHTPKTEKPNPLIYNGYVGKDDFHLWPTNRDWSKSLVNRQSPLPNINPSTITQQTTEPPAVPYNYFLHHPTTNAQSVPPMTSSRDDTQDETLPNRINKNVHLVEINELPSSIAPKKRLNSIKDHMNHTSRYSHPITERDYKIQTKSNATISNNKTRFKDLDPIIAPRGSLNHKYPRDQLNSDQIWSPTKFGQSDLTRNNNTVRMIEPTSGSSRVSPKKVERVKPTIRGPSITNLGDNLPSSDPHGEFTPMLNQSDFENTFALVSSIAPSDVSDFTMDSPPGISKNYEKFSHDTDTIQNHNLKKLQTVRPARESNFRDLNQRGQLGDIGTEPILTRTSEESHKNFSKSPTIRSRPIKHRINNQSDFQGDHYSEHTSIPQLLEKKNIRNNHTNSYDQENSYTYNDIPMGGVMNQTRRNVTLFNMNHEPASSETTLIGLDKSFLMDGQQRNQTLHLIHHINPLKPLDSLVPVIQDNSSISSTTISTSTSLPTSTISTIIPSSHYPGDSTSELSIGLDNPISIVNSQGVGKMNQPPTFSEDPYQRTSSSNIQSTIQRPFSGMTTSIAPKWQNTTSLQEEPSNPSITKPSNKPSSDRLAFILIGGSCALSVVCLVLAAMSMRCQDMCDDYRTLRNAEKAAIKLQKHRLKYTKNHQVARFNNDSNNPVDVNMMDDVNTPGPISLNEDYLRKQCLINDKPDRYNSGQHCNRESNIWSPSNCQVAIPTTLIQREVCGCPNWHNRRMIVQKEGKVSESRRWLHHQQIVQQGSRSKPPFGVGSSVGTFFPHKHSESLIHDECSSNPAILIDSQPGTSYLVTEQRGPAVTSNRHRTQHSRLDNVAELCDTGHECHHQGHTHSCQHHRYNIGTSASDESELTIDECGVSCDSEGKCLNHNHHNSHHGRLRLIKFKTSNHQPTGWKLERTRRSSSNRLAEQNQPASSSESSSIVQCTCSHDQQPLIENGNNNHNNNNRHHISHKMNQKQHSSNHEARASVKHQSKKDRAVLVWSTNRDRLI